MITGQGSPDTFLTQAEIKAMMDKTFEEIDLTNKRVIIIIPDSTRTAPIPLMFRLFYEALGEKVAALDYLVALGTHMVMNDEALHKLVGISGEEKFYDYAKINIFNHHWEDPATFVELGEISADEIKEITGGLMNEAVKVRLNGLIFDYDQIIICGPTFPHEVVGFSGGNKYFFPGIGGDEVINFSHWLGAVMTNYEIIGTKYTPVRQVIDKAAAMIDKPKLCFSMVVKDTKAGPELAGLYIGTPEEAYDAAADLSAQTHIKWVEKPFKRVLSIMPELYDDIWTAAKGMYKMEPVIANGGEVVIYAPHIDEISYTHGEFLDEVGYHVRDYFLKQWDKFQHYPGGVLAHSTHVSGQGEYDAETKVETPRVKVTLATRVPEERCRQVNLGYLNPDELDLREWENREDEGILVVPKAGEMLYRLQN